ncbi:MAG TPA: hypothetical protein VFY20_07145 [Gemmatimonadales bacterium]|nr:hypothetical protein [Gemmatimonadales bacterium]
MARDRRWIALALAVLVTACGGGDSNEKAEQEAAAKFAAARARTDSVRKARNEADSLAQVAWTKCADSVTAALQQTAAGRKTLAAKRPEGEPLPAVTGACGTAKAVTVAATATPAPGAGAALTPAQVELARADSVRRLREQEVQAPQAATLAATGAEQVVVDSALHPESDVLREAYSYGGGARDPFLSLVNNKDTGPELSDLQLVGVYQDVRSAANSVAIVRDKKSTKRYKLRTGDQVGRLRVAQIRPKDVVFTIEDFGFERQETLSLRKQEDVTP